MEEARSEKEVAHTSIRGGQICNSHKEESAATLEEAATRLEEAATRGSTTAERRRQHTQQNNEGSGYPPH